jgi:hypothetical protein
MPIMNARRLVCYACFSVIACCLKLDTVAAQAELAAIRADLSSGKRDRVLSAIAKVEQQRLEAAYGDVYDAFAASKDRHVRRQALFLMSRRGAPQVLQMVREAIGDPKAGDIGIRHLSAYELALQRITRVDDRTLVLPAIQKAIEDPEIYYRKYGAAALASYVDDADALFAAQTDLANDPSDVVRFTLLGNLAKGNHSTVEVVDQAR